MASKQTTKGSGKPKVPVTAPAPDGNNEKAVGEGKKVEKEPKKNGISSVKEGKEVQKGDSRRKDKEQRETNAGGDKEICRDYCRNRCDRGAFCKFYHPDEGSAEDTKSPPAEDSDGRPLCRDFMRNICRRGANCRFYHPPESEENTSKGQGRPSWLTFCHDFQNGHCAREDCRYFHITRGDEDIFRATGDIVPQVVDQAIRKALYLDVTISGTRPTCKEFLKGVCTMPNCRFRHLTQREYEEEVYHALQEEFEAVLGPPERRPCNSPGAQRAVFGSMGNFPDNPGFIDHPDQLPPDDLRRQLMSDCEPEAKRQRYFFEEGPFVPREEYGEPAFQPRVDDHPDFERERMEFPPSNMEVERMMQEIHNLRNDNMDLRRNMEQKTADLSNELSALMQENEGLRRDNTQLRLAASDSEAAHKAGLEKLTVANDNLLNDSRKLQEAVRRLEIENGELRKSLDIKHKAGNVELEQKQKRIELLEKDIAQGRENIMKVNNMLKKAQDENARLEAEMDMMKKKFHNYTAPEEKMGMKQQRENYSREREPLLNDWRRNVGDQDARSPSMRGQDARNPNIRGQGAQNANIRGQVAQNTNIRGQVAQNTNMRGQVAQNTNIRGQVAHNTNIRGQDRYGQFDQGFGARGNDNFMGSSRSQDGDQPRMWQDNDRSRGQYSSESQYGRLAAPSRFEGRDYGLSGYENNQRSNWQQGGMADGGGKWERRGQTMSNF